MLRFFRRRRHNDASVNVLLCNILNAFSWSGLYRSGVFHHYSYEIHETLDRRTLQVLKARLNSYISASLADPINQYLSEHKDDF